MPTESRRWSSRLEGQRAGADAAAATAATHIDAARTLIVEARRLLRTDPDLADRLLTEALAELGPARTNQEHIQYLMLQARMGRA